MRTSRPSRHRISIRRLASWIAPGLLLAAAATGARAQGFVDPAVTSPREAPGVLFLASGAYDPAATTHGLAPELVLDRMPSSGRAYAIVQFDHPRQDAWVHALESRGATLLAYVPANAWIVSIPAARWGALRGEGVRWVEPFHPGFKISPDLGAFPFHGNFPDSAGRLELLVVPFADADGPETAAAIETAGATILDWVPVTQAGGFRVLAAPETILALAFLPSVQWIQEESHPTYRNDKTAWVAQSNVSGSFPMWNGGLHGEGEVIGHIDGAPDLAHCSFRDLEDDPPGPNHRKFIGWRGSQSKDSHGTHTAGTAGGDQQPVTGSTFRNGMADHALLTFTNLNLIGSNNLYSKFSAADADGARNHTNSWGNDFTTKYDAWSQAIDQYSRDFEDSVVYFAVTNLSTLKNPENAKSVVAVGGTNQAPGQSQFCTGGKGPTSDGRRKPEIFLPGCGIQSSWVNSGCGWGSMSGTSMACPAVTGMGTLVRQYYREGRWPSGAAVGADGFIPSGALIRATLLNATVDLTGVSGWPSNREGWGRLLLDNGLFLTGDARGLAVDELRNAAGLLTGEQRSYALRVTDASQTLRITMVFTDVPGTINTSFAPVNDLDLVVTDPLGNVYVGNGIQTSTGESTPTITARDPRNCVEQFSLSAPAAGDWTVQVDATAVNQQQQGYAVVATGGHANGFAWFEPYGAGLAGTGGLEPALAGTGNPFEGETVSIDASNGLAGATAWFLFGDQSDAAPAFGGTILVGGPGFLAFPVTLDGTGAASVAIPIPANPSLAGFVLYNQLAVLDAGAPSGVALSAGLEMHVQ